MRVRLRFAKTGKIRWTSHRDVARMWERAFRRVVLPLAYTGGYVPRPKVSFGLALPTGHESVAEYLDIELAPEQVGADFDIEALPASLTPALPAGITVLAAVHLDERGPSLQDDVSLCRWEIEAVGAVPEAVPEMVRTAWEASTLVIDRERKGQVVTDDVRPGIRALAVIGPGERGVTLGAELATQPRTVRPSELLRAIDPALEEGHVRRTHQWIERDGARWEPISLDATRAPHALWERAS